MRKHSIIVHQGDRHARFVNAPPEMPEALISTVELDSQSRLFELMWHHIRLAEEHVYPKRVEHVIVGARHYRAMLREAAREPLHYMQVDLPSGFGISRFWGLRVHFVPWMDGIVALPELSQVPFVDNRTNKWSAMINSKILTAEDVSITDAKADHDTARSVLSGLSQAFARWCHRPFVLFETKVGGVEISIGRKR